MHGRGRAFRWLFSKQFDDPMDILINGKSTDVGESLRTHVSAALEGAVRKYFDRALRGVVTFSRDAHRFRADLTVHAVRGLIVQGEASADDAYVAFDRALERIEKQLRRYHRRLVNHDRGRGDAPTEAAQQYVLAAEHENEVPAEAQPVVIAEMPTEIASATVGEAVMRMDLADAPCLMFRNKAHGRLNVVYRRADGNVGWIDPAA
jgi:ribosomal subunit interface protein